MALAAALDPSTLLVYDLDGQPLPTKHGFPLRVLANGMYGMKNPKWLTQVDLVATAQPGFWEQQGWTPGAPVQTMARIDTPKNFAVGTGLTDIAGVAFAADRGIQRVEVSTDGGSTWNTAELLPSIGPSTWVFWHLTWQAPSAGTATLVARAVDGAGQIQTSRQADAFPNGASGYHTVQVRLG
jgi:DMSO/TMAO reductase YedYZ molybdopterin-dependent catalytic subunit